MANGAHHELGEIAPVEPTASESDWSLSLIAVLVLAAVSHLAGHLFFDPRSWRHFQNELATLRDALPVVQASLLMMATVLGPGAWWIRVPVCLAICSGVVAIPVWRYGWENVIYIWGVMGIAALGTLFFSVLLSWRGYAIDWQRSEEEGQVRWQFSLLHMIGMTTAAALLVGFYRWCQAAWPSQFTDVEFGIGIATLGFGFALATIWISWELLRPQTWWLRWIPFMALAMLLPVAFWWIASLVNLPRGIRFFGVDSVSNYLSDFAGWGISYGLLLAGTLWVLREAGLRLIVVGKPGGSAAEAKPASPEFGAKGSPTTPGGEARKIAAGAAIIVLLLALGAAWWEQTDELADVGHLSKNMEQIGANEALALYESQFTGPPYYDGPVSALRHSLTEPKVAVWTSYIKSQQTVVDFVHAIDEPKAGSPESASR